MVHTKIRKAGLGSFKKKILGAKSKRESSTLESLQAFDKPGGRGQRSSGFALLFKVGINTRKAKRNTKRILLSDCDLSNYIYT